MVTIRVAKIKALISCAFARNMFKIKYPNHKDGIECKTEMGYTLMVLGVDIVHIKSHNFGVPSHFSDV